MAWSGSELTACHDGVSVEALYGIEEDTLLDTGYEGGASGWTSLRPASACAVGWPADALVACHDRVGTGTILSNPHSTLLDTGYDGSLSGWSLLRMESICDG